MISSSPRHNVKNLLSASLCNPNRGHSSRRARLPPPPRGPEAEPWGSGSQDSVWGAGDDSAGL